MLVHALSSSGEYIKQLRKVISPIRQDMFRKTNTFNGTIDDKSQKKSVSLLLLTLTSMLIDGHVDVENDCSQAALTVAQSITFNARKSRKTHTAIRRHKKQRETLSVMYTSLKIYSTVGSSTLIDHLFKLGICISYSRVLDITKNIHSYLQNTFEKYGIFIPSNVKKVISLF